jgi:hypothetical protein
MAGIGGIRGGLEGALESLAGWVGGALIFATLAVMSAPVGLLLRWIAGRMFNRPQMPALMIGVVVGLMFIPVLHPAMVPSLAFASDPMKLFVVHAGAGLVGGAVWIVLERPKAKAQA